MISIYGRIKEFPVLFVLSYYFLGVLVGYDCVGFEVIGWLLISSSALALVFSFVFKAFQLRVISKALFFVWLGFSLFSHRAESLMPKDIDISYPRRVEGSLKSIAKNRSGHSLTMEIERFCDRGESEAAKATGSFLHVSVPGIVEEFKAGDKIRLLIRLGKSYMCRDLNGFCLKRSNVYQFKGVLKDGIEIERMKARSVFRRCISFAKGKIDLALSKIEDSEAKGVFLGILLGYKEGLTQKIRRDYRACGLVHVLVISGFNIGMVFFLFYYIFGFLLSRSRVLLVRYDVWLIASVLSLGPAYFYSELTGLPYPTLRALLMLFIFVLCLIFKRPFIGLNILFWTAFIISLFEPVSFFSISFELSCAAVFGIIYGMDKTRGHYLERIKASDLRGFSRKLLVYFLDLFCMTVFAILFTLPISVYYFGNFSLTGVLANLIFVPVFSIVLFPVGVASMIFSVFSVPFDLLFWKAGVFAVSKVDSLISFVAKVPYSLIKTPKIYFEDVILYYLFVFLLLNLKIRASRISLTLLVLIVLITKQFL